MYALLAYSVADLCETYRRPISAWASGSGFFALAALTGVRYHLLCAVLNIDTALHTLRVTHDWQALHLAQNFSIVRELAVRVELSHLCFSFVLLGILIYTIFSCLCQAFFTTNL